MELTDFECHPLEYGHMEHEVKRDGKPVKRATKVIDIFGLEWSLWRERHSHMVAHEQESKCRMI